MFWGILIGVVLTVVMVVIAMAAGCKELKPLSYIVILLALVAFCIEGVLLLDAIDAKKNTDNTVSALQEAAISYLPSTAQDYRLGLAEASGLKIGLRLVYPQLAQYIEPEDLAGHTVAESTEVLRQAVLRNANKKIWMSILYMVITLVLGTVLTAVTGNMGGGGSGRRNMGSRGRAQRVSYQRSTNYRSRRR